MCGIAGIVDTRSNRNVESLVRLCETMCQSIKHRGPDDQGIWIDERDGLALGQRRLSIVDLSPAGHQPMISGNGRYVITYNGEIYNFQDLRVELEARGVQFRGHSDTEVMLEAFAAFGVEPTVKRLIGMFAIALWDRREQTLMLIRDRLGIKPLYWAKFGNLFLFGSELKALRAHPGWTPRIKPGAVAAYMRHNYIPAPHSVYEGVFKLEPGYILTLPSQGEPRLERYWDARAAALAGLANPLSVSDAELTDELETLLTDAVRRRMVADVPVGAFLSGGIDSSTVVALMQAADAGPVRTYSIGFDIAGYDESQHAAAVARHLRTEHTELTVTSQQALDVIPRLADMYDEPFAELLADPDPSRLRDDPAARDCGLVRRRRRRAFRRLQSLSARAAVLAHPVAAAASRPSRPRRHLARTVAGKLVAAAPCPARRPEAGTGWRQAAQARLGAHARRCRRHLS